MRRRQLAWVFGLLLVAACSKDEPSGAAPMGGNASGPIVNAGSQAVSSGSGSAAGASTGASAGMAAPPSAAAPAGTAAPVSAGSPGNSAAAPVAGRNGVGVAVAAGSGASPAATAPGPSNGKQPKLPAPPADCPTIATGMITVMGQQVRLWVGPQKGPMVFYWHGTGSRADEAMIGLGPGLNEVMTQGGVVAAFTTTTMTGRSTGNNVWYYSDFDMADQILACAYQQGLVDPQRIYSAGCSAGGIQTSTMAYSRSSYLAATTPNSGGIVFKTDLQDPTHIPFQMSSHGAREKDVIHAGEAMSPIDVYFADLTANNNKDLVAMGGFAINCDHGGEHCANPPALTAALWQFMKDHTFDTQTSPYAAGLPATVPKYCQIVH